MNRRVAVTGMGIVSPMGVGLEKSWTACKEGRSGINRITKFDPTPFRTQVAGEVLDFDPSLFLEGKEAKRYDLFVQYALAATQMALADADLTFDEELKKKTGVAIGTGFGGILTFDKYFKAFLNGGPKKLSPFFIPMMIANMAPGVIAIRYGLQGPNTCTVTACAASSHSIGDAFKIIQRGFADCMIAGGTEASLIPLTIGGFEVMKATTQRNDSPEKASRPFDKDRDGFVPAEGAGVVILEELSRALERSARVYAEIIGYGMSNDAYHITAPDPEGEGAALCMHMALKDGGVLPDEVDYINAHGTSTPLNDLLETKAIKRVFGKHARKLAISSTKSMTGHLLGGAGGVETIFTCKAIEEDIIPPTINYETPDPECDLDYVPNVARKTKVRVALSNSFGFGGTNACLLFRKFEG